ncbi:MAG: hypothetical protein ACKE8R_01340 [Methylophagaceae bacterium]
MDTVKRWLILGGLLAITLWLVWSTPGLENDIAIVEPARQAKADTSQTIPPTLNRDFMLVQREGLDEDSYDLFELPDQVQAKPIQSVRPVVLPRIKPSTPPFPFTYIGKLTEEGVTKVFLLQDQSLLILREGDKVGSNYQLKAITEKQLRWKYLPLNTTQNMSIGKAP